MSDSSVRSRAIECMAQNGSGSLSEYRLVEAGHYFDRLEAAGFEILGPGELHSGELVPDIKDIFRPDPPNDPYDEDGYCQICGNGYWKYHMPDCGWADLQDELQAARKVVEAVRTQQYRSSALQQALDAYDGATRNDTEEK